MKAPREIVMTIRYLAGERTMAELAFDYQLSQARVSQIVRATLHRANATYSGLQPEERRARVRSLDWRYAHRNTPEAFWQELIDERCSRA